MASLCRLQLPLLCVIDVSNDESGSTEELNNNESSNESSSEHVHVWYPIYKTYHYDAEYQTIHHEAEYTEVELIVLTTVLLILFTARLIHTLLRLV